VVGSNLTNFTSGKGYVMSYYLTGLKKYADFTGRARRAEFWYFLLFNSIILVGLCILLSPFLGSPSPHVGPGKWTHADQEATTLAIKKKLGPAPLTGNRLQEAELLHQEAYDNANPEVGQTPLETVVTFVPLLFALFVMIPSIAVGVRRLHDTGRSGWWMLIYLIPFGFVVLAVYCAQEGESGDNAYGTNPKATPMA
jgi:uncharacterized membrane protein YhaH (DUF805 family)